MKTAELTKKRPYPGKSPCQTPLTTWVTYTAASPFDSRSYTSAPARKCSGILQMWQWSHEVLIIVTASRIMDKVREKQLVGTYGVPTPMPASVGRAKKCA